MTFNAISIIPQNSNSIRFDVRNVDQNNPYQVKKIEGLDPDELSPMFYGSSSDGTQRFYDLALKPREITILIQLNPRFNLSETHTYLRKELYKRILATRTGLSEIQFHDDAMTIARLYGFITRFESPQFTKTPTVQITIRCNDPMFRGLVPTVIGDGITAFDDFGGGRLTFYDDDSDAPHGVVLQFVSTSSSLNTVFTLRDDLSTFPYTWEFQIVPVTTFLTGDILRISSEFNNKYVTMERSGVVTNMLDRIVITKNTWPLIFPGPNTFVMQEFAKWDMTKVTFTPAFWGL